MTYRTSSKKRNAKDCNAPDITTTNHPKLHDRVKSHERAEYIV